MSEIRCQQCSDVCHLTSDICHLIVGTAAPLALRGLSPPYAAGAGDRLIRYRVGGQGIGLRRNARIAIIGVRIAPER